MNLFKTAVKALKESNCKTLVAFSNHPDYHDIFVLAANAGILDRLPFENESVTFENCLKILEKVHSRIEFQRKYRRHYQVLANIDGFLDEHFGYDSDGGVDDDRLIPEFAMTVQQFVDMVEEESGDNSYKAAELLKEKLYGNRGPEKIKFERWQLEYSFPNLEEAKDYVRLVVNIYRKNMKRSVLGKFADIPDFYRVFNMAIELGIVDELFPESVYNYKTVLETIGLCSSRSEYKRRYQMNYRLAYNIEGLLELFYGPQRESVGFNKAPQGFWEDYNHRYIAAKVCKTYSEYQDRFASASIITSKTPGEKEKFYWFINPETFDAEAKINFVYVYLDDDTNNDKHKPTAYVGRSLHYLKGTRDGHHKSECQMDNVMKYFTEVLHIEVPEMIILKTHLTLEESQYWEDYYRHFYTEKGYYLINKGATGIGSSSAGGAIKKWTYDRVYECAKQCKTRNDFKHRFPGAYYVACQKNWLDDFYWFVPRFVWDYEKSLDESINYETSGKLKTSNPGCYSFVSKHGFLEEFKKILSWPPYDSCMITYEDCKLYASKYDSFESFKNNEMIYYQKARISNWLEEIKNEVWNNKSNNNNNDEIVMIPLF